MAVAVPILGRSKIKMKPLMILIAALALGLIFLGVVLTIVGHWPGYTSWGGSNPLKYLGPALLGVGLIAMIGVVAYCCVMAEKDDSDYDMEKKEFVDVNSPKSGENTPNVVVREPYETEVKQAGFGSAFRPYNPDDHLNHDVNVLKMLKDSPTREKKYSSNYNTGNSAKVPTPSYPTDPNKKSVGYNSYVYSSDGDRMKVVEESKSKAPYMQPSNRFVPPETKTPYIQPAEKVPPEGPRKWGSIEKILDSSSGSKTPPRSPKSRKSTEDPSRGVFIEKAPRNDREKGRMPALHMPVVGRRSRGRYRQGSTEPPSPTKNTQPDLEEPDLEIKRTLVVPNKTGQDQGPKWGTHTRNPDNEVSPVNGEGMSRDIQRGPAESTPREQVNNSRDHNRDYNKHYSDPQGHTSRRERDRQSRSRHGSRSRDREGRRDRSSSGHRRHRSRSHERDGRGRTRDDVYSAASFDYVTGAPIRRSGRSKSQERDPHRYRNTASRRSKSHDRGLNKSYDSDEAYRRHRYPNDYQSSHSGSRDPYRTGIVNTAYDRDISSDDSHGLSPKHRVHHLNHSNSTGTSADDFLRSGQLAMSPSNKKQTMNFTINVNAQPGSAVQIAMGNQPLPPAKPMLPPNTSINLAGVSGVGHTSELMMTQMPHDSSLESSGSRTRPIRT